MKFALVNGIKTEALKGVEGICPSCGSSLVAKCGEININHWAHRGIRNCDIWWENETEWHRSWKGRFPVKWQEVIQFDKTGERHIADVKTEEGWVLEFQHSYLKPEERRSRNGFYQKLVWVIDGQRRKSDRSQFQKAIEESSVVRIGNVNIHRVSFPDECKLLKEWLDCEVPVFFDFQEHSRIWFLLPKISKGIAYLVPYSLENFIELHNNFGFNEMANQIIPGIGDFLVRREGRTVDPFLHGAFQGKYRRRF